MFQSGLCSSCPVLESLAPKWGGSQGVPHLTWPGIASDFWQPSLSWVGVLGFKERILGLERHLSEAVCVLLTLQCLPRPAGLSCPFLGTTERGFMNPINSVTKVTQPCVPSGPDSLPTPWWARLTWLFGASPVNVFSLGLFQAGCLTRCRENIWPLTQRLLTASCCTLLRCRG